MITINIFMDIFRVIYRVGLRKCLCFQVLQIFWIVATVCEIIHTLVLYAINFSHSVLSSFRGCK